MINITDKHNCCGCSACVQACPQKCIRFDEDDQGFIYPVASADACNDCGLCESVCPCLSQGNALSPLKLVTAYNPNEEIRMKSSSGGIFSMLADYVITGGGVVFGARFDENWDVIHDYTDNKEGLAAFRGSKYAQSFMNGSYAKAKDFLDAGRLVLFSGTGCQIAGLKRYIGREYGNLIAVENLCHSIPSPKVWRMYLDEICKGNVVKSVNFRDKSTGWSRYSYSLVVDYEGGRFVDSAQGYYMNALTSNLITRPSCSVCPSRFGKSGADILLADCWGIWDIKPEKDDNKGCSTVEVFTPKGMGVLNQLGLETEEIPLSQLAEYNKGLQPPEPNHVMREEFFQALNNGSSILEVLKQVLDSEEELSSKRFDFSKLRSNIRSLKSRLMFLA